MVELIHDVMLSALIWNQYSTMIGIDRNKNLAQV